MRRPSQPCAWTGAEGRAYDVPPPLRSHVRLDADARCSCRGGWQTRRAFRCSTGSQCTCWARPIRSTTSMCVPMSAPANNISSTMAASSGRSGSDCSASAASARVSDSTSVVQLRQCNSCRRSARVLQVLRRRHRCSACGQRTSDSRPERAATPTSSVDCSRRRQAHTVARQHRQYYADLNR